MPETRHPDALPRDRAEQLRRYEPPRIVLGLAGLSEYHVGVIVRGLRSWSYATWRATLDAWLRRGA